MEDVGWRMLEEDVMYKCQRIKHNEESRAISYLLSDSRRALSDVTRHVHTRTRARAAAAAAAAAAAEVSARVSRRLLRVAARPCCRTGRLARVEGCYGLRAVLTEAAARACKPFLVLFLNRQK